MIESSTGIDTTPDTNTAPTAPRSLHPVLQLAAFAGVVLIAYAAAFVLALPFLFISKGLADVLILLFAGIGIIIGSGILTRHFDGLPMRAIGIGFDRPWVKHLILGFVAGCALITLPWVIYGLAGWSTFHIAEDLSGLAPRLAIALALCAATALHEEALCRGYGFQFLYRYNRWIAVGLSGLLFISIHWVNPGGREALAIVNLFLGHLLFAAAYLRTRSLWLPIGLHAGWNFAEAFLLGMPVSGRVSKVSLVQTTLENNIWTGWSFGPEGGLLVTLALGLGALLLWSMLKQRRPAVDFLAVAPPVRSATVQHATPSPLDSAQPTAPKGRILAIDALRGVAVLSILPMNMQIFAVYPSNVIYPYVDTFTDSTNIAVWTGLRILIGSVGLSFFSLLFGAGIIMMDASERSGNRTIIHYRRMMALVVIGMFHAYVIWAGDILVTYALCGSIVFLLRKLRPVWLFVIGTAAYLVPMGILLTAHFVIPMLAPDTVQMIEEEIVGNAEKIGEFNAAYGGGWLTQMSLRTYDALANQTINVILCMGWIASGMMLVGMGLYKCRVLTGERSARAYVTMVATALLIGLPLIIYSFVWGFDREWRIVDGFFLGWFFRECSYPIMVLGWIGFIVLLCKYDWFPRAMATLAAAGRMALTNYLMQSVICFFIFYGSGLGLVGQVSHLNQMYITLGVWMFQLLLSPLWLRHFRFGPMEWVWRCLSYGKAPVFRNRVSAAPATA